MKILEDSITVDGRIFHRIQADIPFHGVKVGDIGGCVEKPNNLQDDVWVTGYLYGDAVADGNALGKVFGNAYIQKSQYAKVFDNATIGGDAQISSHAIVCGRVSDHAVIMDYAVICGNAKVYSGAKVYDFVTVSGNACIFGDSSLRDNVIVEGNVTIGNHVIIKDRVIVKGYGYITNYTHIEGDLIINGEDPDSFPCTLTGKCEIKSNNDIIFITNGEMNYVYIKPMNKGFGNPALLQKVKELCIG